MGVNVVGIITVGFGIVFAVLAVIFLVMLGMRFVFHKEAKPEATKTASPAVAATPAAGRVVEDEEEIAAVVAAIAAMMDTNPADIKLRSLREVSKKWKPTFQNSIGGNVDEKLYNKDKWKNI